MLLSDHRIVVVGSANMDLVVRTQRLPLPGETLIGHAFESVSGGKGANQAVAAARLGGDVMFIGCVGNDTFGQKLCADLVAENVDVSHLHRMQEHASGIASITVGDDGTNSIVVALGANARLTQRHLSDAEPLIAGASVLVCQLETPLETVEHAIDLAIRHQTIVIFNAAPAIPLTDALLSKIDFLIINESEAGVIIDGHVDNLDSAKEAAELLVARGARHVLLTLGSQGLWFSSAGESKYLAAHSVTAVDTTAAGDTFIGAFAARLAATKDIWSAIDLGQRAAAISVTRRGAQASIPYLSELENA